jgi:hypothetical protein
MFIKLKCLRVEGELMQSPRNIVFDFNSVLSVFDIGKEEGKTALY